MGIFDYPRIHVFGTQLVNAPTANNDSVGPGEEITVTCDTQRVRPVLRDMDPESWRTWVMGLGPSGNMLRCQWNYFGDMSFRMLDVRVTSLQHQPGECVTDPAADSLIGSQLHLDQATVCDNNPEGFNTTQIFADSLTFRSADPERPAFGPDGVFRSRQPTRAVSRGLNWSRNVSFHGIFEDTSGGAAGASCSFQNSIEIRTEDLDVPTGPGGAPDPDPGVEEYTHRFLSGGSSPVVDRLIEMVRRGVTEDGRRVRGLTFKYNLHLAYPHHSDPDLARNFAAGIRTENPAIGKLAGTIGPWYDDDPDSGTMGRVLNPTKPLANTYTKSRPYYMGPAMARLDTAAKIVTIDMSNTTPADGVDGHPYEHLGALTLGSRAPTAPTDDPNLNASPIVSIGTIPVDRDRSRTVGFMFDLPYHELPPIEQQRLEGRETELVLTSEADGVLLYEPEYHVLLDSECNYLEQPAPDGTFEAGVAPLRDDPHVPLPLTGRSPIYIQRRGEWVDDGPFEMKVEQWRMTPSGDPDDYGFYNFPKLLHTESVTPTLDAGRGMVDLLPAHPDPGLRLFRFVPPTLWQQDPDPKILAWLFCAESYATLRVLPYDDYTDIIDRGPTFADVYEHVFMYYDLIFPTMNERLPMNDASLWEQPTTAKYVKRLVDPRLWESTNYMPRTRDLSGARRELLLAFCRSVITSAEGES